MTANPLTRPSSQTLTNILFIWLGLKGIRDCLRYGHPAIFIVAFIGYMVVGTGSTLFHATLKYPMQLVDELSMIYTTCLMCFATFSYRRSRLFSGLLGIALVGLAWFITARYYHTKDPQFHQDAYAVLTAVVVFSNMWIMEKSVRPALERRQQERSPTSSVPAADVIIKDMWILVATGMQARARFEEEALLTSNNVARSDDILGRISHMESGQSLLQHHPPVEA